MIARVATHDLTFDATAEGRGRKRVDELMCQAALSDAERHELDELLKLYPDLPNDPIDRAITEYLKKETADKLSKSPR